MRQNSFVNEIYRFHVYHHLITCLHKSTSFNCMSSNGSTSLDVHDLWVTWILSDSAFPSGALAVSQGLESAAQHGLVCSAASLRRFFAVSLEQAALQMLPFVLSSHHHAGSNPTSGECDDEGRSNRQIDRSSVVLLDAYCHAMLSSEVARRASISQGMLSNLHTMIHPPIAPLIHSYICNVSIAV